MSEGSPILVGPFAYKVIAHRCAFCARFATVASQVWVPSDFIRVILELKEDMALFPHSLAEGMDLQAHHYALGIQESV